MLRFSSTSFFVFDNLQIKTIYLRSLAHYLTWLQMHLSHSATWFLFSGPPPCVASSRCPGAACSPPWCHWCPSAGSCCRVTLEQCQCQVTQHLLLVTASPLQPGTVLLYLHNRAATLLSYNLESLSFIESSCSDKVFMDLRYWASYLLTLMCHVVQKFQKSSPRYLAFLDTNTFLKYANINI